MSKIDDKIKEIKKQIATEKGFDSWRDYVLDCAMNDLAKEIENEYEDEPYDEVARRLCNEAVVLNHLNT